VGGPFLPGIGAARPLLKAGMRFVSWSLLLTSSLSGCLPFVVPPARLSVGAGPARGAIAANGEAVSVQSTTSLRAGLHPLQVRDDASKRSFDLGVGYGADVVQAAEPSEQPTAPVVHGPFVEADVYPLRHDFGSTRLRFGARAVGDVLFAGKARGENLGAGGLLAADLEVTGDADGPFGSSDDDGFAAGAAKGQWAVGLFAGPAYRHLPDSSYLGLSAGVTLRLPFAVGVVCCAWPGDRESTSSGSSPSFHSRENSRKPKAGPRSGTRPRH
jgi:hypothetical protein